MNRTTGNQGSQGREPLASSPALSRGGGALHGVTEKFQATAVTGAGAFPVPIAMSPGAVASRRSSPAPSPRHRDPLGKQAGTRLSPREHQVLACLVAGKSYKQVAADLGIQIDTVRTYIRTLYRKLQVNSAAAAVACALRQGLIEL